MKALTVRQPWAWAIINGGKDVENRNRKTNYRGRLYIHAGLGYSEEAEYFPAMKQAWKGAAQLLAVERGNMGTLRKQDLFLDYGIVIGTADLIDCHHVSDCADWAETGSYCSEWAQPATWHWVLANARPIEIPFEAKGQLGIWNLGPSSVEELAS